MADRKIGVGDVVAVTARVMGLRGDGSFTLQPLGFDFDVRDQNGHIPEEDVDVELYTVDEPKLVHHMWTRGEELWDSSGGYYVYHKHLGEGQHALNLPDRPQYLEGAWIVKPTAWVASLTSDPPEN